MQEAKKEFTANEVAVLQEEILSRLQAVSEMVGQNSEDITTIKEKISTMDGKIDVMQSDITMIKSSLKRKVDIEEFEALEKRVILLEHKLQKV